MLSDKKEIHGYGIDISENMISNAMNDYSDMTFKVASCESIPFDDDFFDAITVCAS